MFRVHQFETITAGPRGNPPFTICARKTAKKTVSLRCFAAGRAALAFV